VGFTAGFAGVTLPTSVPIVPFVGRVDAEAVVDTDTASEPLVTLALRSRAFAASGFGRTFAFSGSDFLAERIGVTFSAIGELPTGERTLTRGEGHLVQDARPWLGLQRVVR